MMSPRNRMLAVSIAIMAGATLLVAASSVSILYHTAFERQREWLVASMQITGGMALFVIVLGAIGISLHVSPLFKRLEDSEIRFRAIVDNAIDGIVSINEQGVIEAFNPAAERIFGYTAQEAIGCEVTILMPEALRERHLAGLSHYLATKEVNIIGRSVEVPGQRKDGRHVPLILAISEYHTGGQRLFTGILHDITERKQTEEKITQQTKVLTAAIESLDHPFMVIDADNFSVQVSNTAARQCASPCANHCYAISHHRSTPCDGVEHPCPLNEVKRTGKPAQVEHIHYDKNGNALQVEVHAFPIFDDKNQVVQIIEYSLDITKRKEVERRLRALSVAVEQSPTTVVITDTQGTIEYVNPKFTETTGYTAEEAIGQNPRILKSDEMMPEQYVGLWETICSGEIWRGEFHNKRKNGELYWESASISPITDSKGNVTRFLAIKEDITEIKCAQAALKTSEERYRTLYESSKDAVMTLSSKKGFLGGNQATLELFGCKSEEEFTSHSPADLSPERQPDGALSSDKSQEMMALVMEKGSHFFEWTHKQVDGPEFPATVLLVKMQLEGEDVLLATVRDISTQKTIERELIQAQKLESIGQLASGIAHEINTPMQYVGDNMRFLDDNIHGIIDLVDKYAELMNPKQGPLSWDERNTEIRKAIEDLDVEFLKEELPNAVRQSLEGVDRVTTIVRSMKEFAHPGGDAKQAVDLNRAIESTITVARNEWKYAAQMKTDLDATLPLVPCLVSEFNQVILNMIINAAHAIIDAIGEDSGKTGTISISTRHDGNWAEIRIRDTGTGIPDAIREKIFDPFFTTKEVGKGSGQGLAISQATIVKKHGGTLGVESEVGKGTSFIIRLPIEEKSAKSEKTDSQEELCSSC